MAVAQQNEENLSRSFPVIVDEIQYVATKLEGKCMSMKNLLNCLSKIPTKQIESHAGVASLLYGITSLNTSGEGCNSALMRVSLVAIFSGTGINFDKLKVDVDSVVAKFPNKKSSRIFIYEFDDFSDDNDKIETWNPTGKERFRMYMKHYLSDDDMIVKHDMLDDLYVLLKGRCRFSVSFLEKYLCTWNVYESLKHLKDLIYNNILNVLVINKFQLNTELMNIVYDYLWLNKPYSQSFKEADLDDKQLNDELPMMLSLIRFGVGKIRLKKPNQQHIPSQYIVEISEPLILNVLFELFDNPPNKLQYVVKSFYNKDNRYLNKSNKSHGESGKKFEKTAGRALFHLPDKSNIFKESETKTQYRLRKSCYFTSTRIPLKDLKFCIYSIASEHNIDKSNETLLLFNLIEENIPVFSKHSSTIIYPSEKGQETSPDIIAYLDVEW